MDSGPFSTPQSADRRPAARQPEQSSRPPQPAVAEAPRAVSHHRGSAPSTRGGSGKRWKKTVVIAVIVVALVAAALGGWFWWSQSHQTNDTGINTSEYQAVFFTNGQVYFGKLKSFNGEYLQMTDIFYLQAQSTSSDANPQKTSADSQTNVQLIKLGDEIHGPQDEMMIARDQVLFYENLKPSGKVAQSITKYNSQQH